MGKSRAALLSRWSFFLLVAISVVWSQKVDAQNSYGSGYLYGGFRPSLSMGVDRKGDIAIFGGPTANLGAMLFGGGGAYGGAGMYGYSPYAYMNGSGYYGGYPMWGANVSPYSNPWISPNWNYGNYCYGVPWAPYSYGPGYYPYYYQNQMYTSGCRMMNCGGFSKRDYESRGVYGTSSSTPKPPVAIEPPKPSPIVEPPKPSPSPVAPPPPPPVVVDTPSLEPVAPPPPPSPEPPKISPSPHAVPVGEVFTETGSDKSCLDRRNQYLADKGLSDLVTTPANRTEAGGICTNCTETQRSQMEARQIAARTPAAFSSNHVAAAAEEIMAAFYGNCDVLHGDNLICPEDQLQGIDVQGPEKNKSRKVTDKEKLIQSHPYLKQICTDKTKRECQGVCKTTPIFDFGGVLPFTSEPGANEGKISVKPKKGLNRVDQKDDAAGAGVDCSAFVSAALRKAGLRVVANTDSGYDSYRKTTDFFLRASSTGCVRPVTLSKTETVKAGDILTISGHMMIIESAGEDPLGLKKWGANCEVPKDYLNHMNFNVIHSSAYGDGVGVSRMRAKDYLPRISTMMTGFAAVAKQMCLAAKGTGEVKAVHIGQVRREDPKTKVSRIVNEPIFSITRHVGSADPKCQFGKVELDHVNSCAKECIEAAKKKNGEGGR